MKKFIFVFMGALLFLVPTVLLLGGFCLATGPGWDAAMLISLVGFMVFSYNENKAIYQGKERALFANTKIAMVGTILPFLLLVAQAKSCTLHEREYLVLEASVTWLFFMLAVWVIDSLYRDRPKSSAMTFSLILAVCWLLICVIGGLFDFYEQLTDNQIPSRIVSLLGVLLPITAVGCITTMIVGIIQENRR